MKKVIYIIPGLGESCSLARYQYLKETLILKKFDVRCVDPDWYRPLSSQIFKINRRDIVCGFSFGAVLAYLVALKYPCKRVILASISPLHKFSFESFERDFRRDIAPRVGKEKSIPLASILARDVKNITISLEKLNVPYVTISGKLERGMPAQIKVPKTGHRMTKAYANIIASVV